MARAVRSEEAYIAAHANGASTLPASALSDCLEEVLRDLGVADAAQRRTLAAALCEEYALRAGDHPVGAGALSRLLAAASQRVQALVGDAGDRPTRGTKRSAEEAVFDAEAKERKLQAEALAWGAVSRGSLIPLAADEDIPTIDLGGLSGTPADLARLAGDLRKACQTVGFHFVSGHGVPDSLLARTVAAFHRFTALPEAVKAKYTMDAGSYPGGTGYLPVHNKKLPKRPKGNVCQAFIIKRELGPRNVSLDDMPWPVELGPAESCESFRDVVSEYANAIEDLSMRMLPAYDLALGESRGYLEPAFRSPLYRLRMSKYPAMRQYEDGQFGIGPHVDTSFFTVLHRVESQPSLVVWSARTERWVKVPVKPGMLLINTGEILRQASNDTFLAARHYVLNEGADERVSMAYFFNATADYKLAVAPGAGGGPAKYPPTSYLDGQGVVQGE